MGGDYITRSYAECEFCSQPASEYTDIYLTEDDICICHHCADQCNYILSDLTEIIVDDESSDDETE